MILKVFLWGALMAVPVYFVETGLQTILDIANVSSFVYVLINYFAIIFLPKPIPWKKIGLFTLGLLVGILPLLLSPSIHGHQLDWLTKPPIIQLPLTFILIIPEAFCPKS